MKKKFVFVTFVAALCLTAHSYYYTNMEIAELRCESLALAQSISSGEINNPCGNVTFIPKMELRSATCRNSGTHLKCMSGNDNVCCDPSKQTDCKHLSSVNKK